MDRDKRLIKEKHGLNDQVEILQEVHRGIVDQNSDMTRLGGNRIAGSQFYSRSWTRV